MTSLQITPGALISAILLVISFVTFIFAYNKAIKEQVNQTDLKDLKSYVDQQDRIIHHRVDEVNKSLENVSNDINRKLDMILSKLIKGQ